VTCPACGHALVPQARFCHRCGAEAAGAAATTTAVFASCASCGSGLAPSQRFCRVCGVRVRDPPATPDAAATRDIDGRASATVMRPPAAEDRSGADDGAPEGPAGRACVVCAVPFTGDGEVCEERAALDDLESSPVPTSDLDAPRRSRWRTTRGRR